MHNEIDGNEIELGKFGQFILQNNLAPERNARFYVLWVRRFLDQPVPEPTASLEDRIRGFTERLESSQTLAPWQAPALLETDLLNNQYIGSFHVSSPPRTELINIRMGSAHQRLGRDSSPYLRNQGPSVISETLFSFGGHTKIEA